MRYDAMALGPKELSLGPELLGVRMAAAQFPILSANVVLSSSGALVAQPFSLEEFAGHRLAIVGLTRASEEVPDSFLVLNPSDVIAAVVDEASRQADTIILLTNLDYRSAMTLASAVPGIQLVVAALPGQLPTSVRAAPLTGTLVVAAEQPVARHTGRQVGKLAVTVLGDGSLMAEAWEIRRLDNTIPDSLAMAALLSRFR